MINCLLIDDEPLALQVLEDFVNRTPYLKLEGKFEEPLLALHVLETKNIDLLFLDIKMPDVSGIDFFRSLPYKPEVIFTTAYSEFAMDGFELKAMDYLLKPISFEKFVAACNRVKAFLESRTVNFKTRDYFFITSCTRFFITISSISKGSRITLRSICQIYLHPYWCFIISSILKNCSRRTNLSAFIVLILFQFEC